MIYIFTGQCSSTQFQCNSGECISTFFRCDGIRVCADGSDDTGCSKLLMQTRMGIHTVYMMYECVQSFDLHGMPKV